MAGYNNSLNGHNLSGLRALKVDLVTGISFSDIETQVYLNSLNISGTTQALSGIAQSRLGQCFSIDFKHIRCFLVYSN